MPLEFAVLDESSTLALLRIASEEGLLEIRRGELGGPLKRKVETVKIPSWFRAQILEQIVITPKLRTIMRLPAEDISGRLVEDRILTAVELEEEATEQFDHFPAEVIHAMLVTKGIEIPPEEFIPRLDAVAAAFKEAEEFRRRRGKSLPGTAEAIASSVIAVAERRPFDIQNDPPLGYTQEDMEMAKRHRTAYDRARPIATSFDEYFKLIDVAQQGSGLVRTPSLGHRPPVSIPEIERTIPGADTPLALFRVVANQLGQLTHRSTLTATLELAGTKASMSLRELLPTWLSVIGREDMAEAEYVRREIQGCLSRKKKAQRLAKIQGASGYFTAPVALAEFLLGLPPVTGLSIELVARRLSARGREILEGTQWIEFGNTYAD